MSIRLRLTLLYSAILALTLIVFGTALYTIQAQETMNCPSSQFDSKRQRIRPIDPEQLLNPESASQTAGAAACSH